MASTSSLASPQRPLPFNFAHSQLGRSRAGTTASAASTALGHGPASTAASASGPLFKAPQHKHAHHLHSIPPREKSTRTLILDHMLWIHARTRLQQARAELGMSVGREFAAGVDGTMSDGDGLKDEDEQMSDGEDIMSVKFSAKDADRQVRSPAEDEYDMAQNLPIAHNLRQRADGVEKVLIAMLDQPPEVQPPYSDDDAPRTPPAIHGSGEHHFPNGVRLRLALSTLVNDLFARDVPTPISPRSMTTPSMQPVNSQTPLSTPQVSAVSSATAIPNTISPLPPSAIPSTDTLPNGMPVVLSSISPISSYSNTQDRTSDLPSTSLPSIDAVTRGSRNKVTTDVLPPIFDISGAKPRRATGRVLVLYEHGADPSTANSPPSLRCPRHLHHSCQICAPAKSSPQNSNGSNSSHSTGASPRSPVVTRGAITLGANGKGIMRTIGAPPIATQVSSWNTGPGIGAGLGKPGLDGTVLRRRSISHHSTSHPKARDAGPCASGGKLADLIPRFIRLSALVAVELGREAKEKEYAAAKGFDAGKKAQMAFEDSASERDTDDDDDVEEVLGGKGISGDTSPTRGPLAPVLKSSYIASPFLLSMSFRPTREWYAILAGLLTRGVLEGYLSRGWKGPLGMECLLGVGLGLNQQNHRGTEGEKIVSDEEFEHLDPDDCPSVMDAAKILFPVLCKPPTLTSTGLRRERSPDGPEAEYEAEMVERISEVSKNKSFIMILS